MNSSTFTNSFRSIFAGALVATLLSAVAVYLVVSSAPPAPSSAYLFARHVTFSSVIFAAVFAVLWQSCGILVGLYGSGRESLASSFAKVLACSTAMTILLGLCMSIKVPKPPLIRSMAAFMGCALACELVRLCMEMLIQERSTRVVIVGCDRLAAKAWREFRVHRNRRMEVVGFVNQCAPDELMPDIASRRLGGLDALPRIVMDRNIDDVIIATDIGSPSQLLEQSVAGAATLGTRILCLKDICGIYRGHMIREYGDNLFELAPAPRLGGFRQALKRLFDVTISTIVLVFGLSLVLPLAVFSLLRGRSIAYQSQLQLGFRRRKYRRWRLNSAPRDRRVRLFLELLSSMWNVFCGDMSLVGPPPVSEAQAAQADIAALAGRFSVRPGLIRSHMDDSDSALVSPTSDSLNWSLRMDVKTLTRAFRLGMERSAVIETEAGAS